MFKKFLNLWRGRTLVESMIVEFGQMLNLGKRNFTEISRVMFHGGDFESLRDQFFANDQMINDLEQDIRRKVVIHLTQQAHPGVSASLIMMNVVKDAERMGDYSKNIFEIFDTTHLLDEECEYRTQLLDLTDSIIKGFDRVREAFVRSDVRAAENFIREYLVLQNECDDAVARLLVKDGHDDAAHPVAYALLFRFYKRILCHQTNIASSLTMPVDKLDFHDEPLRPRPKGKGMGTGSVGLMRPEKPEDKAGS